MPRGKAIPRRRRRWGRRIVRRAQRTTLPLAVLAGFVPLGVGTIETAQLAIAGKPEAAARHMSIVATGYDPEKRHFYTSALMKTYTPLIAGMVVHKVAGWVGVNRALARAKVPLLRV